MKELGVEVAQGQARGDTQNISDECSQYWEVVEEGAE